MKLLVLGGAGYIGSHFSLLAKFEGHEIITYDNLSTGHRFACTGDLVVGDVLDTKKLIDAMRGVDVVCHFAAKSVVSESVAVPSIYEMNNVKGTASVIEAMKSVNVKSLVFSSTAAVYGDPEESASAISESQSCNPVNPYGASKLSAERLIADYVASGAGSAIAFRYFNAAGALPEHGLGEAHDPETHLIPNILKSCKKEQRRKVFTLYGNDYATRDGTCIRDYVHVCDIAQAHILGIQYLAGSDRAFNVCNLGSENGYTNLEVIKVCEEVTGRQLVYDVADRREGDPTCLLASSQRAKELIGWKPEQNLEQMITSAWRWHLNYHG